MSVSLPVVEAVYDAINGHARVALNGKMEDAWQWQVDLDGTDVIISFLGIRPNTQGINSGNFASGELGGIEGRNFARNFGTIIRMDASSALLFYASIKTAISEIAGLGDRP